MGVYDNDHTKYCRTIIYNIVISGTVICCPLFIAKENGGIKPPLKVKISKNSL